MELAWVIYLIDNVSAMKGSFWALGDFIGATVFAGMILYMIGGIVVFLAMEYSFEDFKGSTLYTTHNKLVCCWFKFFMPLFIVGSLLNFIIPSQNTAYKMLAAYGVQEVVQVASGSEDIKRMASKSLALIEKSIDKYQKEFDKEDAKVDNTEQKTDKQTEENKDE